MSTNNKKHDPLGAVKSGLRRPQRVSPWKKHLKWHGRKWIVAGCTVFSISVLLLLTWSIMISIEVYGTSTKPRLATARTKPATQATRRQKSTVEGPVRIGIRIGRLIDRERVLVVRDITQIMKDRLQRTGFEVQASADNVVEVRYRELIGDPVSLVSSRNERELLGEVPTVKAYVEVSWVGSGGSRILGHKTITAGVNSIAIEGDMRSERSRHHNSLNQKIYTDSLAFLRRVDLPIPKR